MIESVKFISRLAIIAVSVASVSCTKKQESATIKVVMPQSISTFDPVTVPKQITTSTKKITAQSDDTPAWNTSLNPTAGSQINCFAVFVGGPNLAGNSCQVTDGGVARKIEFGPNIGFVPSGSTVRLDVPAGSDRVFHVVGLRAATAAACSSYQGTELDEDNLSEPFLIASQRANIPAGESTLNIVAALDVGKKISTCSFVNRGGGSGGGGTTISFGSTRDGILAATSGSHYYYQHFVPLGTPSPGATHTPQAGGVPTTKILGADRRVTAISTSGGDAGRLLTVSTSFSSDEYDVGDEIIWHVTGGNSSGGPPDDPITGACGGGLNLGRYGFSKIESIPAANQILLSTAVAATPSQIRNSMLANATSETAGFCRIAITRVSNFDEIQIASGSAITLIAKSFDQEEGTGGTLVLRAKRLSIDGSLNLVSHGRGHPGGLPGYGGGGLFGFGGFGSAEASGNGGGTDSGGGNGSGGGAGAGEGGLESILASRARGGIPLTHGQSELFNSISSGNLHSCGVTTEGKIKCFGDGQSRQLGMGAALLSVFSTPHLIESTDTFSSVVSGFRHTCALKSSNGYAYCWGLGSSGQIGNNSTTNSGVPLITSAARSYSMLTAAHGGNFNCAIEVGTGAAYCWGQNLNGQLGDGSTTNRLIPTQIPGHNFKKISAGQSHACGINMTDQVYCWGNNLGGRLGDTTTTQRTSPVLVDSGVTYKSIAAGENHTCGITSTDDVKCWGDGSFGQLGNNSYPSTQATPVTVAGGAKYKAITTGYKHTCAITATDDVHCWGNNLFGQLGDSTQTAQGAPTPTAGAFKMKQISAGGDHTCGVSLSGDATYCWGKNDNGQLGVGNFNLATIPTKVRDQKYPLPIAEQKMFSGGGGGGSDQAGGYGGGIVLLYAKEVTGSGSLTIDAGGVIGNGTSLGSGGGGGGTIGVAIRKLTIANAELNANGGGGAASFSAGGGGGGAIQFQRCVSESTTAPSLSVAGGPPSGVAFGGAYGITKLEDNTALCSLD